MGNDGVLILFVGVGVVRLGSKSPATGAARLYVVTWGSK